MERESGADVCVLRPHLGARFTHVGPVSADAPLEEARAAVTGVDSVVFPRAAVAAHFARDVQNPT